MVVGLVVAGRDGAEETANRNERMDEMRDVLMISK